MRSDVRPALRWSSGNAIDLLQSGVDFFPALCRAIDEARVSVHLETYIFTLDRTGQRVLESLEAAARRGIHVRVVVDGFGSFGTANELGERIIAAGGKFRVFRPEPRRLGWLLPSRRRLRRLHRKTAVIDGLVGFVGGINVIDDYDDPDPGDGIQLPRFDFAVQVNGPVVADLVYAQDLMWVRLNWARLRRHPGELRDWRRMRLFKPGRRAGSGTAGSLSAALVLRDNLRFRQTFEQAYLYGIHNARRDILIANAYFFPGRAFRKTLLAAAARGVRVRLLLQGKTDHRMQYHATRVLYDQLLAGGIEIYEYMPSQLHAKVAAIDSISTVGSSNLDPFSLLLAREANVVIDDDRFTRDLRARIEQAIEAGGRAIGQQEYRHRGWLRRSVDTVSYALLRIGVALTGRSGSY